ncbi:MAG: hypothetical protein IIY07_00285 [Thermoguttaceae bacterium]|nr:hypothetical protein [Thermoguttaceae bacterium]
MKRNPRFYHFTTVNVISSTSKHITASPAAPVCTLSGSIAITSPSLSLMRPSCRSTHASPETSIYSQSYVPVSHNELGLPIFCLLDNDPWGYYIYSVVKQGSINLAYESDRMATPDAKFIGLRSRDFERCGLTDGVKISLSDVDRKRAKQIAEYPWFANKKDWQREIDTMMKNGFKLEVEALLSRSISYMTEEYVPRLLKEGDFLD